MYGGDTVYKSRYCVEETCPALAVSFCFKSCPWQKKALTAAMHGQVLSSPQKEKGFFFVFIADIQSLLIISE
ncbi:hypothetical protein Q9306_03390 [Bacillus sp. WLY-B-L8]|nr:hypothetical protein [Bacillus sp. WLY-B-L8]